METGSTDAAPFTLRELLGVGDRIRPHRLILLTGATFFSASVLMLVPTLMLAFDAEWTLVEAFQMRGPTPWHLVNRLFWNFGGVFVVVLALRWIKSVPVALAVSGLLTVALIRPVYNVLQTWNLQAAGVNPEMIERLSAQAWAVSRLISSVSGPLVFYGLIALALHRAPSTRAAIVLGPAAASIVQSLAWSLFRWSKPSVSGLALDAGQMALFGCLLLLATHLGGFGGGRPGRISRASIVDLLMGGQLIALALGGSLVWSALKGVKPSSAPDPRWALLVLGATGLACMIMLVVIQCRLIYRAWAAIQDAQTPLSPAAAVGWLFVPIFGFYWNFRVVPGFAREYNRFIERRSISAAPMSDGALLAFAILAPLGVIPIVGVLVLPATFLATLVAASRICEAVNALPVPADPDC